MLGHLLPSVCCEIYTKEGVLMQIIAERLKTLREGVKMTQTQIAALVYRFANN